MFFNRLSQIQDLGLYDTMVHGYGTGIETDIKGTGKVYNRMDQICI